MFANSTGNRLYYRNVSRGLDRVVTRAKLDAKDGDAVIAAVLLVSRS